MAQVMTCDITSTDTKVVLADRTVTRNINGVDHTWDASADGEAKLDEKLAKLDEGVVALLDKLGLASLLDKAEHHGPEDKPEPVSAPPATGGMSKNKIAKLTKERNGRIRAWASDEKNWAEGTPAPGKFPNKLAEAYQLANPHDVPVVG